MTKKLTIKDRVDRLLKEGVDNPKKWMPIHGYEEPTWQNNDSHGWAKEWRKLRDHHLEETAFLFEVIREMANRLNPPPPPPKVGDRVKAPWWEYDMGILHGPTRVDDITGTIIRINGAYHYIKVDNNSKLDVVELYPNEFEVVKE